MLAEEKKFYMKYCKYDKEPKEVIVELVQVIEKQQKEIESLNLENIELKQNKIVEKNSIPNQYNFYDCYNYIHKDKIKAKIEELRDIADNGANAVRFAMTHDDEIERIQKQKDIRTMVEILQSLLEKE